MEALEAILTRRSIRQFTEEMISEELIHKLLEAAMSAPSARNYQPWHFVIVSQRTSLNAIAAFHPYAGMLKLAPLGILICGDKQTETYSEYIALDCSAATENMLLAAHALGLGAVWLGIYPVKDRIENFVKLLNIPSGIIPVSFVAIGHPAETKYREIRFDLSKVHQEIW
ncbi:MAG: nitroreductase family protein [Ignavibacteria bacterium]